MTDTSTIDGAVDYLGHPCRKAALLERFGEPFAESSKMDPRALRRQIAIDLEDLIERVDTEGSAIGLAAKSLRSDDDIDGVLALLKTALPHNVATSNLVVGLIGRVLVLLEHPDVAHG